MSSFATTIPTATDPDFLISDAELAALARQAQDGVTLDRQRAALETKFREIITIGLSGGTSPIIREAVEREVEDSLKRVERLKRSRGQEHIFSLVFEDVPRDEITRLQRGFGIAAAAVLSLSALLLPVIMSILITTADKVPQLVDAPVLAGVWGVIALAGAMASAHLRSKLKTEHSLNRYDKRLLRSTAILLVVFVCAFALSAFPITLGGEWQDVSTDAWGTGITERQKVGGFTLSCPTALSFVLSTIYELFAAASLHLIAMDKLNPKRLAATKENVSREHFSNVSIPQAEAELECANAKLAQIDDDDRQRAATIEWFVSRHMMRFDAIVSEMQRAQSDAINDVMARYAASPLNESALNAERLFASNPTRH